MNEWIIVAGKHIVNYVKTYDLKWYSIDINKDLYFSVKGAKYKIHAENNKEKKAAIEGEHQKPILTNGIVELKNECHTVRAVRAIEITEKDVTESILSVESKGNALKNRCDEQKNNLVVLQEQNASKESKKNLWC